MDYRYLPQENLKKWAYNEPVELLLKNTPKLFQIIPNKETAANYNKKVTEATALNYNMVHYL